MANLDIFPNLLNRLNRDGHMVPQFIGEFDGVKGLPRGEYPAIYYWKDTQIDGGLRLSFNTPLLESVCVEEAQRIGLIVDTGSDVVQAAIAMVEKVTEDTFPHMLEALFPEASIGTVPADMNRQTTETGDRRPWWRFWR